MKEREVPNVAAIVASNKYGQRADNEEIRKAVLEAIVRAFRDGARWQREEYGNKIPEQQTTPVPTTAAAAAAATEMAEKAWAELSRTVKPSEVVKQFLRHCFLQGFDYAHKAFSKDYDRKSDDITAMNILRDKKYALAFGGINPGDKPWWRATQGCDYGRHEDPAQAVIILNNLQERDFGKRQQVDPPDGLVDTREMLLPKFPGPQCEPNRP